MQKDFLKKYFLLTWKKGLLIIVLWIISVIIHNFISGLFNIEESVFFIIAIFIIPLYFIVCLIYSIFKWLKGKK